MLSLSFSLLNPSLPSLSSQFNLFPPFSQSPSLLLPSNSIRSSYFPVRIRSLKIDMDAPDFNSNFNFNSNLNCNLLTIAIIGFSNYAQFLSKTLVSQGHTVLAHCPTDESSKAHSIGVSFFLDPNDLCQHHPQVILLCTSVLSAEEVVKSLPLLRFDPNTLFVDVLPVNLLLDALPSDLDIICSHPMFGSPQSDKHGWDGVNFVYERVRIGAEESRIDRCEMFLDIFSREGCRMVELSCEEHDKYAAGTLFITHTVGTVLQMLKLESTPINTKGYESLLELIENSTAGDSFHLYYGLFVFNKNALEMLQKLDLGFQALKKQLFGTVHEAVRKQLSREPNYVNGDQNGAATPYASYAERSQGSAQPYQYKARSSECIDYNSKIKIGIVGFGNFGQFLAKTFVKQGHTVLAYSRSDYSDVAQTLGVSYFSDADDMCEEHPEVILLCTSILSTENVLKSLPIQRLKRNTLFVDVLSVKEFSRNLFLQHLPPEFDILCTHPMFGPESGKNGWSDLPFVFDIVRVGSDEMRLSRCERFLDIFAREGCRMVEMSCVEHDRYAAGSQFVTHTMGRILEKLGLEPTPINTKEYEILLNLVENTASDSFDLYYGLFIYNVNATKQLERLELAFECLKKQLFGQLHDVQRKQLFENAEAQVSAEEFSLSKSSLETH